MSGWPRGAAGLSYGADYNPEQWPEATWREDVRLMREAGVSLVSVGIFSWALLEPEPGRFEFGWLDRVLDALHEAGIRVDLATATASPPPWFSRAHPESLPVTRDGRRLWPGSRQAYCPSSAAYRAAAGRLVEALASRYAGHPALALWHVNNEYGCHVAHCFCDASAAAFRAWLRARHGDLNTLNAAWSTAFWSQRYGDWEEITPPRATPAFANPAQVLDFWRFSSDELRACFRAEREILRRITPHVPLTTNFMTSAFKPVDYWTWAPEVDVVATDHYLRHAEGDTDEDLALSGDLTRGLARGRPWILMEHSPSAVNWQPRNVAKRPREMRRNSLAHVARGADAVLFFQWRASRGGAEKFHSAMVPHAGTESRVWREVVQLGSDLRRLAEVRGSRVRARAAIVWDWPAWWALELPARPSVDLRHLDRVRAVYAALWRAGITTDVVAAEGGLDAYDLLLVPSLYLTTNAAAENISRRVRAGARAVIGAFSGIVDEHDRVRPGGYPGAFRELLGVRVEEFCPLLEDESVRLDDGTRGRVWTEDVALDGARALAAFLDGPVPGRPAVTRHASGAGAAFYAATELAPEALARLLARAAVEVGVGPAVPGLPDRVEAVRRHGEQADYLFLLNHGAVEAAVRATGLDLLTGVACDGLVVLEPRGVAVLREG